MWGCSCWAHLFWFGLGARRWWYTCLECRYTFGEGPTLSPEVVGRVRKWQARMAGKVQAGRREREQAALI